MWTLFVLRRRIPLAAILTGANAHDVTQRLPLMAAIPPVRGIDFLDALHVFRDPLVRVEIGQRED